MKKETCQDKHIKRILAKCVDPNRKVERVRGIII